MPAIVRNGSQVVSFPTRAECLVFAFARPGQLVFDQHSRRRNQLIPGVEIVGKDYEEEQTDA